MCPTVQLIAVGPVIDLYGLIRERHVLMHFSKTLLPVFAVGLEAPKWCQMLWRSVGRIFLNPA